VSSEARLTSAQIENLAISFALDYERSEGRSPVDTRHLPGAVADISSPPRTIEVKAAGGSARGQDIWLESRQYQAATTDPTFFVYVVDNVAQADPFHFRLHVLSGDRLARLLNKARQQSYFLVPWPVGDYDADG
jgi:hypothetical protein